MTEGDRMNFEAARTHIISLLKSSLPHDLPYHNVVHTERVERTAGAIARTEGLGSEEITLLRTAALCHDAGYLESYQRNEPLACDFARRELPAFDYTAEQINKVCAIIMATALPQRPSNRCERIICDADLEYLGSHDYHEFAAHLRAELAVHGQAFPDAEWIDFQLAFLKNHNYFTDTVIRLRGAGKQARIAELERMRDSMGGKG